MEIFIGITAAILAVGLVAFTVIYNIKRFKSGKEAAAATAENAKAATGLKPATIKNAKTAE